MKKSYAVPETVIVKLGTIMQPPVGPGPDASTFDTNNQNLEFEEEDNDETNSSIWDTSTGE
jgi:hypothetical protein